MKYTEKEHAEMLIKILEMDDTCNRCPFTELGGKGCESGSEINILCCEFVGITNIPMARSCPCWILGSQEAVKRTWAALEEKGYI